MWNLGSVAIEVFNLCSNVPDSVSGTMLNIADRSRNYCELYTGNTIGSNAIDIQYQNPILHKTLSEVAQSISILGGTAQNITIGDFSTSSSSASSISTASTYYKTLADNELSLIGRNISFFQLYG